jgi:hypothetical protein
MAHRTTHLHPAAAVDRQPSARAAHLRRWRPEVMPRYRKRPGEIEAVRWNGANRDEVHALFADSPTGMRVHFIADGTISVPTSDGERVANRWDWLIRDDDGAVYPITHQIFAATYEPTSHGPRP